MISEHLRSILEAEYPRFSDAEMAHRRRAVEALLAEAACGHLLFCGANRFGSAVQWLTGWPVTAEAGGVPTPGRADAFFLQDPKPLPQAQPPASPRGIPVGRAGPCPETPARIGDA